MVIITNTARLTIHLSLTLQPPAARCWVSPVALSGSPAPWLASWHNSIVVRGGKDLATPTATSGPHSQWWVISLLSTSQLIGMVCPPALPCVQVIAIMAWVTDNLACKALHSLPFGLPYPQLHATVWHTGMAYVCHCMCRAVLAKAALRDSGLTGSSNCMKSS